MKRRLAVLTSGFTALICAAALGACKSDANTLYVYAPVDYVDDALVAKFKAETGITVRFDTFDTNEAMYTNLKNDTSSKYDVLMPSEYMIERMRVEGMLEKVDWGNVPNRANIDPMFTGLPCDPDDEYYVAYMWGTVGLMYNTERVPPEDVSSWNVLWSEKYRKKIFMMDSVRDSLGVTLKYLGFSLNTENPGELELAKEKLIEQKPFTLSYVMDTVKDKMIGDEGDIAVVYSGDAIYAREENENLAYAVPIEGSNIWYDGVVILKGAKHKAEAERFIDFLCRPDVAADRSIAAGYTTANRAALDFLPDELRLDPTFWPSGEVLARCEMFVDLGDFKREYDKAWNDILTAR